jgi:ATP-dependent protease ClpP protease subunit
MKRQHLIGLCTLLLAAPVLADVVVKRDGSHLTGTVIREDPDTITLQSNFQELVTRQKIARKDIAEIQRDDKPDATFCRIPIEGEIGTAVKAEWLAKALEQAAAFKPDYLILYIDSGGGSVTEMEKIVDLLKKKKDLKLIAHVKKAASAAAIIAMACPTIILATDGSIGAAVPFTIGPKGTPQDVEAKWFSFIESGACAAADAAGHSPLLVRGMMEINLTLSRVNTSNSITIVEGESPNGVIIKKPGQILTLQGRGAVNAGLAAALADELSPALFGHKTWVPVGETAWSYMKSRPANQHDAADEILSLRKQLAVPMEQAKNANDAIAKLKEQVKTEAQSAEDEYIRILGEPHPPSQTAALHAQAKAARDTKIAAIKTKYFALLTEQVRIHDAAAESINTFITKLQQLAKQGS